MVHNDIHDDTDIVLVRGVNQILEVLLGAEVEIRLGVVEHIVAVIGIVREIIGLAGGNIAVDLLIGSGEPDGVGTEFVEVAFFDLLGNTLEVTAVEGAGSGVPAAERSSAGVKRSAVGVVVGGVAVVETVGQEKIDVCVVP